AEEAVPHYSAADQSEWLTRISVDHDNMRTSLDYCRKDEAHSELGLRLAGALSRFWHIRGLISEGRRRLAELLSVNRGREGTEPWATALTGAGILAWDQGERESASRHLNEALAIWQLVGDDRRIATTLGNLGLVEIDNH